MFDYNEIRNQVITSIESGDASVSEYDIDAIMDELRDIDVHDLDGIDADEFWDIIARNAR